MWLLCWAASQQGTVTSSRPCSCIPQFLGTGFISEQTRERWLNEKTVIDPISQAYKVLWNQTVDPAGTAIYFIITLPFDGMGQEALDWIRHMRFAMDDFKGEYPNEEVWGRKGLGIEVLN